MVCSLQWGVGSYVFGINHNGRVIFHPHWKTLVKSLPIFFARPLNFSDICTVCQLDISRCSFLQQKGRVLAPIQNEVDLSQLEEEAGTSSFNITYEHEVSTLVSRVL